MASAENWISSEVEQGILLSETEENGIVTRTYIAPMLEHEKMENKDPLALPKKYPMPYFCPHCGNGIGSSGAFTMHLRACQRRMAGGQRQADFPAKFEPQPSQKSYPHVKPWRKTYSGPFQCIFCSKEFEVKLEHGQGRRRYACDDCGQKARAKEAERQKNPKVKGKSLTCDRCGKKYKLEGFLVRHQILCQGISEKKKKSETPYEIHEITKKKLEEKIEVIEL
ncbi:hypothetical protein KR200_010455, partial [Drosophila serrata]